SVPGNETVGDAEVVDGDEDYFVSGGDCDRAHSSRGLSLGGCYHNSVASSLYDLDPGPDLPNVVRMIVEIPRNSTNKYEYDGKLGVFRLDRALYSPMHYPGDYGFVPGTRSDDGDPLDVLVMVDEPSYPGVLIHVRPLGMLEMLDQNEFDQKI